MTSLPLLSRMICFLGWLEELGGVEKLDESMGSAADCLIN
jgi:hypothetical protein